MIQGTVVEESLQLVKIQAEDGTSFWRWKDEFDPRRKAKRPRRIGVRDGRRIIRYEETV